MKSVREMRDNERGMSLVFVALGMLSFMAATTLAIDVGMFMVARNQAQNSADAAALAGAIALVKNNYDDRTPTGPVVQSAIQTAQDNLTAGAEVSVGSDDVTFPLGPSGDSNRVQVQVYRDSTHGNPVSTLVGGFFGVQTVNVQATAVAEASPANAMTCVKPFMIPDKWIEKQTGPWDASDTYDKWQKKDVLLPNPDEFIPGEHPGYTGYSYRNDLGRRIVLRAGTGGNIVPSFYYSWKMPEGGGEGGGITGADFYRWNIANCNQSVIVRGAQIIQEPGSMSGPTIQGIEELIAKDPDARWDDNCNCLKGSRYRGQSPRVFPIPLYDPEYTADRKALGRDGEYRISNFLGFFAESVVGNQIYGRVTTVSGLVAPTAPSAPATSLPYAVRLVQ
jgi:hypothetical protein